jgi:hypothetical protein
VIVDNSGGNVYLTNVENSQIMFVNGLTLSMMLMMAMVMVLV